MKFSCIQENLFKGLQVVSHIAGTSSGLPILANILLKTEDGFLTLCSTNLEMGVKCTVRGKVETEGVIAIDARIITEYLGLLPKDRVELEVLEGPILSISCGTYHTQIKGVVADEYPILPPAEKAHSLQCRAKDLKKHLQRVVGAAKYDETRMELSGVLFVAHEKTLTLVATDAYRLAESTLVLDEAAAQDIRVIVPLKTVQELLRNLSDDPEMVVQLMISDTQITAVVENIELVSKLVDGQYPDYTQIIPSSFSTRAVVDRQEWMRAVKASSIFSKSGLNDVTLDFAPGESDKGILTISSANTTVGETAVKLDIQCSGSAMSASLNYRYLLDGLQNMTTTQVSVGAIDSNSPCILKPVNEEGYQYMVMPIRE